jgi:acetaldehyde dehydrogenase/alcohol dehydrogenase
VIRYNVVESPTKLAAFPQYTHPESIERYARAANVLGLGGKDDVEKVELLARAVEALRARLPLPASIEVAGVNTADFLARVDALAEQAFDDQCTGCNPRYPLISELRGLYLAALKAPGGAAVSTVTAKPAGATPVAGTDKVQASR